MPTDAVWVIVTIPRKEYEKEIKQLKRINNKNKRFNIPPEEYNDEIKRQIDSEVYMEKILSDTLEDLRVGNAVWVQTRNGNYFQVYFPCDLYENDLILQKLLSKGIGTKSETSIGYIPFNLFFYEENTDDETDLTVDNNFVYLHPGGEGNNSTFNVNGKPKSSNGFKEVTDNFLRTVTSRLTVAQVVEGVKAGSEITFDFCWFILMGGFVCAAALVENDAVNIGASMMIEGIMGTVMAQTFGIVIHDKKLFWLGCKSQFISLLMTLVWGFIWGLIFFIWMTEWNPPPDGIWPTSQMQGRGTYEGLIYGVLIALPCGGAVAVSLLQQNHTALVGVALASTFLPPFMNAGMQFALCVHVQIRGLWQTPVPYNISGTMYYLRPAWAPQAGYIPTWSNDMRAENALIGCVSMALTGVNIVSMIIVAVITLWIKEIVPLKQMSKGTQRFFKEDIRVVREYNKRQNSLTHGNDEPIGDQILKEWAELTGLDKKQLLDNSPEARITRLQTLYDIVKDVEADETYQHVTKRAQPHPNKLGLMRRLTQPSVHDMASNTSPNSKYAAAVFSIEQELTRVINGRRYTVEQLNESNQSSPYSTITSARGYRPSDLKSAKGDRRNSQLLKQSLKHTSHSPYSVWPGSHMRNPFDRRSSDDRGVRRRQSVGRSGRLYDHNLQSHEETTGF